MVTEGSLTDCARDLHSPDPSRREQAARLIWERFSARLRTLVLSRLDARILRRVDADDVLQSLFASFFAAPPRAGGPLRLARGFSGGSSCTSHCARSPTSPIAILPSGGTFAGSNPSPTPQEDRTPDRVSARSRISPACPPRTKSPCGEEFEHLLAVLPKDLQRILALRLDGNTNAQIAALIDRSERLVELKLKTIRGLLRPHLRLLASASNGTETPS